MDIRGAKFTGGIKTSAVFDLPGAPTIGTVTVLSDISVSVGFTAPASDGGTPITKYTAVAYPGNITGTVNQSGSGSVTITNLSPNTSYTFTVYATNSIGNGLPSGSTPGTTNSAGEIAYITAGTYNWTVPADVTSISIVAVGGGAGGGSGRSYPGMGGHGGNLSYKNNVAVTPGTTYVVTVGEGALGGNVTGEYQPVPGGNSSVTDGGATTLILAVGGGQTGASIGTAHYSGGNTGQATVNYPGGGGGAGGYANVGGNGGNANNLGSSTGTAGGSGGSGGGGAAGGAGQWANGYGGFGGGGVGIYGLGTTGAGATNTGGNGGSGGANGVLHAGNATYDGHGGAYGGGGGGGGYWIPMAGGPGGVGAVRIIWPGTTRTFPSTRVNQI